jgi:Dolichyl-phosphate-mannose-protein mannosyltransferase
LKIPRDAQWETTLAFLGVVACYFFGRATGWMGVPRGFDSTAYWPFYTDTWFEKTIFTGRVVLPLLALALVWPIVRRWLDDEGPALPLLLAVVAGAWIVHLSLGFVRHGVEEGLQLTFRRAQEYWRDSVWVGRGFLASFPEIGHPLSVHGATHPPGIMLFLGLVRWLGFDKPLDAELVSTPLAALAALPLYGAARRLGDDKSARMAVGLFLFACCISLFAVLSMDMLTMLCATVAFYGFARALDGEWQGGVLLGVGLAAAALCNFIALMLPLGFLIITWARRDRVNRASLAAGAFAIGAFALFYLLLWALFGYRPFHVFFACLDALKGNDAETRLRGRSLLRAPLAYYGALGVGLTGLAVRSLAGAIRRFARRLPDDTAWIVAAATLPWLLPVLAGKPRAEVEHVFLLFVPLTAFASSLAARRWFDRAPAWVADVALPLAVLQAITVEVLLETYW